MAKLMLQMDFSKNRSLWYSSNILVQKVDVYITKIVRLRDYGNMVNFLLLRENNYICKYNKYIFSGDFL